MGNPYTEPGWEELLDSEWVSTETEIPDLIAAIRELHARLAQAKADLEDISAAFPDDATHKHEVTGESLVDNVRDALRDLAKAKADLDAARAGGTR